jgi:hypothetical protein
MKVKVKAPFFDERGIHKKGEIVDVKKFKPEYMELVEEENKTEKVEKAVAKTPKKTIRSKKG